MSIICNKCGKILLTEDGQKNEEIINDNKEILCYCCYVEKLIG